MGTLDICSRSGERGFWGGGGGRRRGRGGVMCAAKSIVRMMGRMRGCGGCMLKFWSMTSKG